jgi:hypothetical protein
MDRVLFWTVKVVVDSMEACNGRLADEIVPRVRNMGGGTLLFLPSEHNPRHSEIQQVVA